MATAGKSGTKKKQSSSRGFGLRRAVVWMLRGMAGAVLALFLLILAYTVIDPPVTPYMLAERSRYGALDREWVDFEDVSLAMAAAIVAAEDANFCQHWGFDMAAIRAAIDGGGGRGASTISQQVVKNVFLWQGRSWPRKALEAMITPVVELVWSKRRILEIYMNVAETGKGRFGVAAAARAEFGVDAADLSEVQAARIAALLPAPKNRSASSPGRGLRGRAASIVDGAATIRADGRADCFLD
ncbi:MAG: monofunctional biosynthetic peptidoglycan transglycosylase [Paracoccaceae bacterium]